MVPILLFDGDDPGEKKGGGCILILQLVRGKQEFYNKEQWAPHFSSCIELDSEQMESRGRPPKQDFFARELWAREQRDYITRSWEGRDSHA